MKKKQLTYLFFVLAGMTNVKEHFLGAQKVFWQVLYKLKYHFFGT